MRTGVSPKRIATRIFCCLLRHAHPSDSRYCFATARARPFALCLFMLSASHACKHAPAGNPARRMAPWQLDSNSTPTSSSLERRWSSRTFRYGYLVTTSPQLSRLPSTAPSLRLGHWLRAFATPMVWRAVCTRPGNVFTATFWFAITSDSSFM